MPKEMINHFSMFKEVEAKLHDPEQMLKELFEEIAQLPVTTKSQLGNGEHQIGASEDRAGVSCGPVCATDEFTDSS